ncbi:MAG: hypothetical protein KAJ12_14290 [Bacteroidetes bacterium]|nr:hypothetical protein [Bacteroidota bacterium]
MNRRRFLSNLEKTTLSAGIAASGVLHRFARLRENGLTSVSLASSYHAGKFLAPRNPRRKVVFLQDGTIYFESLRS